MALTKTHRGKLIDMSALREKNKLKRTIGNIRRNVRGDQLGPDGKVVKTREQVVNEKYNSRKKQVTSTKNLNELGKELAQPKPVKFAEEQAKKNKNDLDTLGKYDVGKETKKK